MQRSSWLGLAFLSPALIVVLLFFMVPVVLTGFFAFTNMSTATGVKGGEYVLNASGLRALADAGLPAKTLDQIEGAGYRVDARGLEALAADFGQPTADEFGKVHTGEVFAKRRDVERALKGLRSNPIRKTRDRKAAAELFKRSMMNERFPTLPAFEAALEEAKIPEADRPLITKVAYTGWVWTAENFGFLFSLESTWQYAKNTGIYVVFTLSFNVLFGLFLAIATFYLPAGQASTFRAIWFLPRILPPVLYIVMWRWFTWDTGFISTVLSGFGVAPKNWMLDTEFHAWTTIVLINGFVGASMGMIVFSSAIRAIPSSMLYASEVDGANRLQQIWHIILPQLRWPILFITSYQTMSLLTSFEYIYLATDGGPGGATEVWALAAFHTALNNYGGNLQYGLGATYALLLVVIGLLASLAYLRLFNFRNLLIKPRIEG
ncbi:carbohydrate ABC transporter permease [Roseibium album]|uniref:carbohydrate ABC transporter permease n=1 Tax=Roseibium album TaxID=311410 RepID=UPI000CF037A8|nr:inositol-phosphate transport system permease protein [Labrenzia sp. EL_142]